MLITLLLRKKQVLKKQVINYPVAGNDNKGEPKSSQSDSPGFDGQVVTFLNSEQFLISVYI